MRCEKHKNYKGVKPPIKGKYCQYCQKLYAAVNKASSNYYSITTPGFYCSISHILAECMTIMLFGKQPPFFWRKETASSKIAKKFFSRAFVELKAQQKKNPEKIEAVKFLFGIIVYNEKRKIEAQKIRDKFDFAQEQGKLIDNDNIRPDLEIVKKFLQEQEIKSHKRRNKWEILSNLEKNNGSQEKRE